MEISVNLTAHFYNVLAMATIHRNSRPDEVPDLDGTMVPAWARHERQILVEAVNDERKKHGKPPVTEADVRRGERVGDPKYGAKLAEFCAALVVE